MSKTTTNLLLMLITILAGTYFYISYCSECATTVIEEPPRESVTIEQPESTSYPFAIRDGDFSYEVNDNYNFNVSSSSFLLPTSEGITTGINQLQMYFSENDRKIINVTGFYKSDETNNSALPDLGLARAIAVKNNLVSQGVSSTNINTKSKLMDEMVPEGNVLYGPISFQIDEQSPSAEEELYALFDKINENPLVLYFNTAEASINLDMEQRQKVADISRYIDKVENATISIVGHTDNTGQVNTNMKLGLDRANFAKEYLVKNGIPVAKINTSSKGQSNPIAENTTEKGKSKNRRTVVTLIN